MVRGRWRFIGFDHRRYETLQIADGIVQRLADPALLAETLLQHRLLLSGECSRLDVVV